jgi:mRNA-degrading endonuclease RelE of RelBE toxin-antitoxin system
LTARYRVRVSPTAERALLKLPESVAAAAIGFITGALLLDPKRVGKPLRGELRGLWSARRGPYQVIYRLSPTRLIDQRADDTDDTGTVEVP